MTDPEAWTIGRILTWSTEFLQGRSESPRLDAEVLLAHALSVQRIQLYTHYDKPLSGAEREPFKGFLKRRSGGEPVAYITGQKEFMGLAFAVGPAVLIPRPDTEVLVETVMARDICRRGAARILDVGTGSGCIAISLAANCAGARVAAWDVDEQALAVARANAERHGAAVAFSQADALSEAPWSLPADAEPFDLVVSNPPYISPSEAPGLPRSVVGYEPAGALFAPPDGLAFYRAMASFAPRRLTAGGRLMVEIGSLQSDAVTAILAAAGWQDIATLKDYARLDRVVSAERPA
jgi:release factor glutamine methyltransferase